MRYMCSDPGINLSLPNRAWYWGPMFRYERPQAGRLRQFHQFGVEQVGGAPSDDGLRLQSDYEIIKSGWQAIQTTLPGVPFKVHVNTLGDENTIPNYNKAVC